MIKYVECVGTSGVKFTFARPCKRRTLILTKRRIVGERICRYEAYNVFAGEFNNNYFNSPAKTIIVFKSRTHR